MSLLLEGQTLVEEDGAVYVPSHSGLASAIDRKTGKVIWKYKISNSLLNPLMPAGKKRVIVSSMDGTITCLSYE